MKTITILIPAYNEEDVLHLLYNRLIAVINNLNHYNFELLFVNDGSSDKTLKILRVLKQSDNRISYLNLSRNFGKEIAMVAGIDFVSSDALIIIDADLQDPPELIPQMITHWEEGYKDIYAKRNNRSGETWLKKWTAEKFYKLLQTVTKIPIQQNTGDFRLLDRQCIDALKSLRETQRYTKGLFSWIGFEKKEILFNRDPRAAGKTKWNYFKLFDLAIEGFTSFTTIPLRLSTIFGLITSIGAFIFMLWVILKTFLLGEEVAGYPSLMTVILFLGGIQLFTIGIIGEYLGRIFLETKRRPLYFVSEYSGNLEKEVYEDKVKSSSVLFE
ncbi:glycosyltransferase family 2 protein [Bacillus sp. AGMB 02131]|uniref:Glycosyltransferase family 2 protein n=1 Tax=Peribacillus faecalis TaxID=2772559 RepID=A0A927H9J9_9BACI|nr:glycosyltransferase family 2 protein [Peribacillus faecalis]MBD3107675.1 glycosyltransferase family 2 protein [Peribacillus faecalis]